MAYNGTQYAVLAGNSSETPCPVQAGKAAHTCSRRSGVLSTLCPAVLYLLRCAQAVCRPGPPARQLLTGRPELLRHRKAWVDEGRAQRSLHSMTRVTASMYTDC